jgi:indolepyruvate ferredoxin oxidoreductase alpha subunit
MLNRQRREKPLVRQKLSNGERVTRDRFYIDPETCTGDRACIRVSGCPSLTIAPNADPLRVDPVTRVDDSCVGCGLCGENAHASILCPSFVQVQIVSNASAFERWSNKLRGRLIRWLQRRRERQRVARFAAAGISVEHQS